MGQSVEVNIQIEATTIFGARHGLETLSQLIAFDKSQNCFQVCFLKHIPGLNKTVTFSLDC